MEDLSKFLLDHQMELFLLANALWAALVIVVKLTPTKKDDEVLDALKHATEKDKNDE